MELDPQGKRYEILTPEIPYELSAGAYADLRDEDGVLWRYHKSIQILGGLPFAEIVAQLRHQLELHLSIIEGWTSLYLRDHGQCIKVP